MPQELLVLGIGAFLLFGCGIWLFLIEKRFRRLFKGKTVEALVYDHQKRLEELEEGVKNLEENLALLNSSFLKAVQKVRIIRFNPFRDTGGDQSFVVALLDAENSGFVLSSLYAQGRPMVYAKPITRGTSKYALSGEEEKALHDAIQGT